MKQNTLWRAVFDLTGVILIQNLKGPTWFLRYQSSPSEDYSVAAQKKELYHLLFDFCTINILGVKSQKQAILA